MSSQFNLSIFPADWPSGGVARRPEAARAHRSPQNRALADANIIYSIRGYDASYAIIS